MIRRLGNVWERAYPIAFGLAAAFAFWKWNPSELDTWRAMERMLNGGISAAAVLAGFQVTALTLLLSVADKPIVMRLRELGFFDRLIGFHWRAIVALFMWLVLSLILLAAQGFIPFLELNTWGDFVRRSAIALVGVGVWALCASYRVIRLMVMLLKAT